jgi:hypothetical protein
MSHHTPGSREERHGPASRARTQCLATGPRTVVPADPRRVQCGDRRTRALPCAVEACVPRTHRSARPQGVDAARARGGEDRQRLARAVLLRYACQARRGRCLLAQTQDRRRRKGPLARGRATLVAGGAVTRASGCLRTRAEAAVRDTILHPREALASLDVVEQHETSHLAHPWHRVQAVARGGLLWPGRLQHRARQGGQQTVVGVNQGQLDFDTLGHGRSRAPGGHPRAMGLRGDLLAERRHVGLAVGLWALGQACGPCAQQRHPAPSEVARDAPGRRLDIGLGQQAAAAQPRHLLRIARVVCGLTPLDRVPGEGVAEPTGNPLAGAPVGEPGPRCTGLRRRRQARPARARAP